MKLKFTAVLQEGGRYSYPPNTPSRIEVKPNGSRVFHFPDASLTIQPKPTYTLTYAGWIGQSGRVINWYDVGVSISGRLLNEALFFEAWNYKIDARRHYRFDKVLRLTNLQDGSIFTAEEWRNELGGIMKLPLICEEYGINRLS